MDEAVFDEWFGGGPPWLEDALAEADLLAPDQLNEVEPDTDWTPLSVTDVLARAALLGPCPEALRLLAGLEPATLTAEQHLQVVELLQPIRCQLSGLLLDRVAGWAGPAPLPTSSRTDFREAADFQPLELSLVLDCSENHAGSLLMQARALTGTLTATGDLLRAGQISDYKASIVVDELGHLEPSLAQAIESAVLSRIRSDTATQLKRRIRRARIKAQGTTAEQEYRAGAPRRRVRLGEATPDEPGLLSLQAMLPPETVLAIWARLRKVAAGLPVVGRSYDQRLADAFALLLLGPSDGDAQVAQAPQVTVNVTVDLLTLFWLRDHPGELEGYGPIPAGIARSLAGDATWTRFVHDPVTGHLLDLGRTRYVPSRELARFVKARDRYGRFPGSSRKAQHCDNDHVEAFDATGTGNGGSTSAENLASQARKAHRAKTHGGYTVSGDANHELTWTTPAQRTYRSRPHDYRPDPDDPGGPPVPPAAKPDPP
jgi:hypothetical protein